MSAPKLGHVWVALGAIARMGIAIALIGAFCAACIYFAGPGALPPP